VRNLAVVLALAAIVLPSSAAESAGAEEFERTKYTVMLGAGLATVSTDEGVFAEVSSTPDDLTVGLAGGAEVEYRITRPLSVGVFGSVWASFLDGDFGSETWFVTVYGASVRLRPLGEGFHVGCGVGISTTEASLDDAPDGVTRSEHSDWGFGASVSVGYEFAIADTYVGGPRLEILGAATDPGVTATAVNLVFAFTF
jgi:hypothetical protein